MEPGSGVAQKMGKLIDGWLIAATRERRGVAPAEASQGREVLRRLGAGDQGRGLNPYSTPWASATDSWAWG